MQLGATCQGFRILSVPRPTNWRPVPLSEFDLELNKQGEPLVGITGDTGPTICLQYRDGIVEYDHRPTAASLDQWYRTNWMGEDFETVRAKASIVSQQPASGVRLNLLEGLTGLGTAVDVGAGYGDQVRSLQRIASKVTVIEPCQSRADALRAVYGCDTLIGSFPDVKCEADLIVCHHVIEHVHDAERVFAAFAECQPDGGRLVITCPNFMGEPKMGVCLFWPHQRSFTREGLLSAAARHGYHAELEVTTAFNLAVRFVKVQAVWMTRFLCLSDVTDCLRSGLGLGGPRTLIWQRDYDGTIATRREHLDTRNSRGAFDRVLEIDDITNRKTDCPIELQWAGETQVFVK